MSEGVAFRNRIGVDETAHPSGISDIAATRSVGQSFATGQASAADIREAVKGSIGALTRASKATRFSATLITVAARFRSFLIAAQGAV